MKRKSVRIDRKEFDNAEICDPESNWFICFRLMSIVAISMEKFSSLNRALLLSIQSNDEHWTPIDGLFKILFSQNI